MRDFHIASDDEIKNGDTTDVYFVRTKEILEKKGLNEVKVTVEVTASGLPNDWSWGVLCGIEEIITLFKGVPVDLYSMPEGSIFYPKDYRNFLEPVITIEGRYSDFCKLETPLLGLICQSSGVATKSARVKKLAGEAFVISFGIRRIHPALSPMIDRASFIGGLDGVSSLSGARAIGKEPTGTMPHALIIMFEDQVKAWQAFDEVIPEKVPRIALIDTYYDEKTEAIMAAEALKKKLQGVRLDTPSSRRGNFEDIIREVRWELDIRGFKDVKIFVSGGLDEDNIQPLIDAGAYGFGVGTSISNSPTIDFAMDIIEVEGKLSAKRGKLGGKKQVWRCPNCLLDLVQPEREGSPKCPSCKKSTVSMLKPILRNGEVVEEPQKVDKIRDYVLEQISKLSM